MELFDKFYQTIKPTDEKTYKKIINFAQDDNNKYQTIAEPNMTSSSIFTRSKFEHQIIHKLGYEWKNIYRNISHMDQEATGEITIQ